MARFIPFVDPSEIHNKSERKVAQAIESQLPNRVSVIHSFNWIKRPRTGPLIEGECDFIVLDPEFGLLFLEVKGGILGFDSESLVWWRADSSREKHELEKDPVEQVQRNMYEIVERIKENLGASSVNFSYGFGVVFPDGVFQGNLPPQLTRPQVLDANDLSNIEKRIDNLFGVFHRKSNRPLSKTKVQQIIDALLPAYQIIPVLWQEVAQHEQKLHRSTEEQKNILDVLESHRLAAIKGQAGTGKTLLALAKAQQMAQSGLRTLFLCYNRPLRNWLSDTAQTNFESDLSIRTYHELVYELCLSNDVEFDPSQHPRQNDFWVNEAPELLMTACDKMAECKKFDAVIIDEGQDFQELWWHSLDSVFKNPEQKGCFYVFLDPNQNLWVKDEVRLPQELGVPYKLHKNCRNAPHIASYCDMLIGNESDAGQPTVDISLVPSRESGFDKITALIGELTHPRTGGLKLSQIVVLVPGYPTDDWPSTFKKIPVCSTIEDWRKGAGILIETFARFKGLEADAVVLLTETVDSTEKRDRALNYVASSRAKHILEIVQVESEHTQTC